MDLSSEWVKILTQLGFPALVAWVVMKWTAQRIEKSEDQSAKREGAMAVRIQQLETKIEDELIELVKSQGTVVSQAKMALSGCTVALQDCANILVKLKQSAPSVQVPPGSDIIVRGRDPQSKSGDAPVV